MYTAAADPVEQFKRFLEVRLKQICRKFTFDYMLEWSWVTSMLNGANEYMYEIVFFFFSFSRDDTTGDSDATKS